MHICMIIDNPETAHHPIIGIVLQKLSAIHRVRMLDVRQLTGAEALAQEERHPQADLYLLKSHAAQALEVAHVIEQRGALVINSWAATLACQDRVLQGQLMKEAELPWPDSYHYDTLGQLLEQADILAGLPFPLIVKSRYSRRGDLVAKVDSAEQLRAYAPQWSQEPVALQKFMAGDGWDIKMWVIDQHVFAARRRTPLAGEGKENYPFAPDELPEAWVRIAREIGRAFNLHLYGVDLLMSDAGPIVVDVNSFPGFRGVAGADDALVALVEKMLRTKGERDGSLPAAESSLAISELPSIVTQLFARAQIPLLPGSQGPVDLFVRYLRRKPQRGLAVVYSVDRQHTDDASASTGLQRLQRSHLPVSLTLDESALEGSRIRIQAAQIGRVTLATSPGMVQANELGLSVQVFPTDNALPELATCCDTAAHSPLFQALERAARQQLDDPDWQLVVASAEPVRYKPASRCVIRYTLTLEKRQAGKKIEGTEGIEGAEQVGGIADKQTLVLYGKVYADVEQAQNVQATMQALYAEQVTSGQQFPLLPRPLGVSSIPGLVFNEAVQPIDISNLNDIASRLRQGKECFGVQLAFGRGGEVSSVILAEEELRLTAQALAQLHTSTVQPIGGKTRTGAQEAKRARERAMLLARHSPQQADEVLQLAQKLATALETRPPEGYRPAHGGFKSSQLLFHSQQVFVVDFDGFCLADPALDVGYFLAYLRPASLWYARPGARQWFEASAEAFIDAYQTAMQTRGVDAHVLATTAARAKLYEAALLFKIATRRVNRLNSPRPKELAAMLNEIARCLSGIEE